MAHTNALVNNSLLESLLEFLFILCCVICTLLVLLLPAKVSFIDVKVMNSQD